MNPVIIALGLSFFAGLSTCIGAVFVLTYKKISKNFLSLMLGFSVSAMIYISIGELIPDGMNSLRENYNNLQTSILAAIFICIGMLIAGLINSFIPEYHNDINENNKFKHIGIITAITIMLHNFPEGITTFVAGYHDISIGLPIVFAVAMHNIPEGIAVALPIYYSGKSRKKALAYTFFSGMTEPLGAFLAYIFLAPFLSEKTLGIIFLIVAGIMIYISFKELLPASNFNKKNKYSLLGIMIGIIFMALFLNIT